MRRPAQTDLKELIMTRFRTALTASTGLIALALFAAPQPAQARECLLDTTDDNVVTVNSINANADTVGGAVATGPRSLACGTGADGSGVQAVALGRQANATGQESIAIGGERL
jgi:hypothetical protein